MWDGTQGVYMLDKVHVIHSWGWIYIGGSIAASGAIGRNNRTIAIVTSGKGQTG